VLSGKLLQLICFFFKPKLGERSRKGSLPKAQLRLRGEAAFLRGAETVEPRRRSGFG